MLVAVEYAMYQVAFLPEQFGKVVPWLMLNREGLDILVHPSTGDDVGDHTDRSLWLGEKLELNIEILRASGNQLIIRQLVAIAVVYLP